MSAKQVTPTLLSISALLAFVHLIKLIIPNLTLLLGHFRKVCCCAVSTLFVIKLYPDAVDTNLSEENKINTHSF